MRSARRTLAGQRECPFVSLVFQEAPRGASVLKLLPRESERSPFRGLLTHTNGRHTQTTLTSPMPRSAQLDGLYANLEALAPAFASYVVFDPKGDLVEVQVLSTAQTEAYLGGPTGVQPAFDEALIALLLDHASFLVIHAQPANGRLEMSPSEWVRSLEREPIELLIPSELALGATFCLDLASWCLTLQGRSPQATMQPQGGVLSGPSEVTRSIACDWVLSAPPREACERPPDPALIASEASLVVTPHARLHLWAELAPQALLVDATNWGDLRLDDLVGARPVLVAKELLLEVSYHGRDEPRTPSALRASATALVRRLRCGGASMRSAAAQFHAVHFRRLVVEDISYDLASGWNTVSATTRLALTEDGAFFGDRSYAMFTGSHPQMLTLEGTACVHRALETQVAPEACVHEFETESLSVGPIPCAQLLALKMSTPRFLARLTPEVVGSQFTDFGRSRLAEGGRPECPICFTNVGKAFLPCGHSFCFECAERLPVESIGMAIQRAPLRVQQHLVRRCPVCRSRYPNIFATRVSADRRQRLTRRLARGAATREVWICAHWRTVLAELRPHVKIDGKEITLQHIDQSTMFPASGAPVTVIWVHPPCFLTANLDALNMHRAFHAAGRERRNVHIICSNASPETPLLRERFVFATKRRVAPRSW